MIITNLKIGYNGRLGNQLFQFASLYGIGKRAEKEIFLPEKNLTRISERYADGKIRQVGFDLPYIFPKLKKFLWDINPIEYNLRTVEESKFGYDPNVEILSSKKANINLNGYFQSLDYFYQYQDEIIELLTFKQKFSTMRGYTSIHIRRGDYLHLSDYHENTQLNYYFEAMNLFSNQRFFIFSDDIEWCKKQFNDYDCVFSEDDTQENDLMKMSLCENNIICNSTFSWWGAFLNRNTNKTIVAPKKWFGKNNANHDTTGLLKLANIVI